MKLQFLIPQYKETEDVVAPLLDSIAIQQNVDMNDIGVIICNDGTDVLLSDEFLNSYPFKIEYYRCEHNGVSATRNACLDHATADYVMFCDADDMFFNACGLYIVMQEIANGFDSLVSMFIEEIRADGKPYYVNREFDSVFVHGKVHRRGYLIDNNIRWDDSLTVHEDSYFNRLCQSLSDDVKYSPSPFYLWKWRDDSVCRHDPKYILKTYNNLLDSCSALTRQFLIRKKEDLAISNAVGMIYDAYFTMNKSEWLNQENQEYRVSTEKRFKEFYYEFKQLFDTCPEATRNQCIMGIKNRMFGEGLMLETITFDEWIKHIEQL